MCKWKMLAGNGYNRFGSTVDEAVCAIIRRYSRMYGCLEDARVKALIYLISESMHDFYDNIESHRVNEFWSSDKGIKLPNYGSARRWARSSGLLDSIDELRDKHQVNLNNVFDLWVEQTSEVHSTCRCAGRWYNDGVAQVIAGVFTPFWSYDEIDGSCYGFDGCYRSLYKSDHGKITNELMFIECYTASLSGFDLEYWHSKPYNIGECRFCGGALVGVVGSGTCECIELARMNKNLSMDVKLHRFFEKAGMTIEEATTEQIRCAVKLLTIKYAGNKFKLNQPKKNTRKAK